MKNKLKYFMALTMAGILSLLSFGCGSGGGITPRSEPIPTNGTVFVGRHTPEGSFRGINATVVVIYGSAAYVGYLRGPAGYATFQDRFTRLALAYNNGFYRVTNASSLWSSAWMHDAYPLGLIFNENGTMDWIHPLSCCCFRGSGVDIDGMRWPVSRFSILDNIEISRLSDVPADLRIDNNILSFDSPHQDVFVLQTGENETSCFRYGPINLENWNFSSAGEYEFRLRSLGGYAEYGEDGYLKGLTVSSELSSSHASFTVAQGEQVSSPKNFRLQGSTLHWDDVPNASGYYTSWGFGNSFPWATVGSLTSLGAGTHTVTITAHRDREVINGVVTFFPSSEPAAILWTNHGNGTFSYAV